MEGGERKLRGFTDIDWDKLIDENDEAEPPQLVVERTSAVAKKRKLAEMDGGDEQSEAFRGMSNKELKEKIERLRRNLATIQLPDGGEKFRMSIKRHEDELERRYCLQRQKDDEKCNKQPQFQELSCSGDSDGSCEQTPSSLPNNGSEFGKRFLKKMEKKVIKKTDHKTDDAFRKELSTLNRTDGKWMRSNGHHSSMERHYGGLSSRQRPFQCPSSLSTESDKQILSNCDQKGKSSTSPPNHSEDDLPTRFAKKGKSNQVHPSYGVRSSDTVVFVDDDEPVIGVTTQQVDKDECSKEAIMYYPSRDDPESTEIRYSDLECLGPEAYVSSTIMNFYIRYMQQHRYSMSKQADGYHFFNTYFYQKLKEALRKKNDKETTFAKVRRWWKGVKLFEKAYIFLPIHEHLHWSLVIICIPDKEAGRGPILLHLDSLGLHSSKLLFENIRRFLIGEWEFLRKEESHMSFLIPNKIWDNLPRRIEEKTIEVPQQRNDYDCGLFVLFFIERFIEQAPKRVKKDLKMFGRQWFKPKEASNLRHTICNLLKEEFKKAKEYNCLLEA